MLIPDIIYPLFLLILFVACITLFRLTYGSLKKKENDAFLNNFLISLTFLIAIIMAITPLVDNPILLYPFDLYVIFFTVPFFFIFYILVKLERRRVARNGTRLKNHEEEEQLLKELPLKYEIYRKVTHLVVIGICFVYFTFSVLVKFIVDGIIRLFPDFLKELLYGEIILNLSSVEFAQYLVVFLTSISLIGLLTADYVRIVYPEDNPFKSVNKILRQKELKTRIGPHISMAVGNISIILIFGPLLKGPLIVSLAITMSIIGDSAANLIGINLGRHKIRGGNKSYEGLIAGIAFSYLSGLLFLVTSSFLFQNLIHLQSIIILPIIVSISLGIIDYLDLPVDDNLTFLLISSIIIYLLL